MSQFMATHHGWCPGPKEYDLYDVVEIPEPSTLFDDFSYRAGTAIREQTLTLYEDLRESLLIGDPWRAWATESRPTRCLGRLPLQVYYSVQSNESGLERS